METDFAAEVCGRAIRYGSGFDQGGIGHTNAPACGWWWAGGTALCDGDLSTSWFMSAAWFRPAGNAHARTGPRRAGAGCAGRPWWPWLGLGGPAVRAGSPG